MGNGKISALAGTAVACLFLGTFISGCGGGSGAISGRSAAGTSEKCRSLRAFTDGIKKEPELVSEKSASPGMRDRIRGHLSDVESLKGPIPAADLEMYMGIIEDTEKTFVKNPPVFTHIRLHHLLIERLIDHGANQLTSTLERMTKLMAKDDLSEADLNELERANQRFENAFSPEVLAKLSGYWDRALYFISLATNIWNYEDETSRLTAWNLIREIRKKNPRAFCQEDCRAKLEEHLKIEESEKVRALGEPLVREIKEASDEMKKESAE